MALYLYIVDTDSEYLPRGTNPNYNGGVLSLCSCKAAIRRTVQVHDWILGVSSANSGTRRIVFGLFVLKILTIEVAYAAFPEKRADIAERRDGDIQLGLNGEYLPYAAHRCKKGKELEKDSVNRCPVGVLGDHPASNRLSARIKKCPDYGWLRGTHEDFEYSYYWGEHGPVFNQDFYEAIRIPEWKAVEIEGMLRQGHRVIRWNEGGEYRYRRAQRLIALVNDTTSRYGYLRIRLDPSVAGSDMALSDSAVDRVRRFFNI